MKRKQKPTLRTFECIEPRICLTSVGFAAHEISHEPSTRTESVETVDMDGDGDLDALMLAFNIDADYARVGSVLSWYENTDGNGAFSEPRVILESDSDVWMHKELVDLNGDSFDDLLIASANRIAWLPNLGTGGFDSTARDIRNDVSGVVAVTDIDGDNDVDVVFEATECTSERLFRECEQTELGWYENSGTGDFVSVHMFDTTLSHLVTSLHTDDVDGDGDYDVVTTSYLRRRILHPELGPSPVSITVYLNQGSGDFSINDSTDMSSMDGEYVLSTKLADVDSDDDTDIVILSTSPCLGFCTGVPRPIRWYENNGVGEFVVHSINDETIIFDDGLAIGDIDSDGDADVFTLSFWYENTNSGFQFEQHSWPLQ